MHDVEPVRRLVGDVELRAVRALPRDLRAGHLVVLARPRVGHGERTPLVPDPRLDLAVGLVARPAGAGALGAAALDHEVRDHAMELQVVVEPLRRELLEVGDGRGRLLVEELDDDVAAGGRQRGGFAHDYLSRIWNIVFGGSFTFIRAQRSSPPGLRGPSAWPDVYLAGPCFSRPPSFHTQSLLGWEGMPLNSGRSLMICQQSLPSDPGGPRLEPPGM